MDKAFKTLTAAAESRDPVMEEFLRKHGGQILEINKQMMNDIQRLQLKPTSVNNPKSCQKTPETFLIYRFLMGMRPEYRTEIQERYLPIIFLLQRIEGRVCYLSTVVPRRGGDFTELKTADPTQLFGPSLAPIGFSNNSLSPFRIGGQAISTNPLRVTSDTSRTSAASPSPTRIPGVAVRPATASISATSAKAKTAKVRVGIARTDVIGNERLDVIQPPATVVSVPPVKVNQYSMGISETLRTMELENVTIPELFTIAIMADIDQYQYGLGEMELLNEFYSTVTKPLHHRLLKPVCKMLDEIPSAEINRRSKDAERLQTVRMLSEIVKQINYLFTLRSQPFPPILSEPGMGRTSVTLTPLRTILSVGK